MARAGGYGARSPLGMPFPYHSALQPGVYRDLLKAVKECKRVVPGSGVTYFQQIQTYTAALPYHWELYPEDMTGFLRQEITEQATKRLFEKEGLINWSTSLPTLHPLVTTGDGNCLLHAVALYMWGIEDTDLFLRTSLWETLVQGSFSAKNMRRWQAERNSDQAAMDFEVRYNTNEWNEEYDLLKSMAAPTLNDNANDLPYKSLEEFHIYALANMLRRPILVISGKKMRNMHGASLQPQLVSGLYLPFEWDPSLCYKFPIVLGFSQSHFFPLIHTAPENVSDEADFMVPLILQNEPMKLHFTLPGDDTEALTKRYLHVDNFIHCPKNRETAVGLLGAKLSCENMGRNYSVWDPYFDLAETQLRIYNEGEYNPGSSSDLQELEFTSRPIFQGQSTAGSTSEYQGGVGRDNISEQFQNLPPTASPSQREQGQCKTPGCPYQQSFCTGDLCVECFNKGQREKCRSGDCLNKADVGLAGFCKVCHDGNKFQQASSINKSPTRVNNGYNSEGQRASPPSSDEDRFKTNGGDDLNSLAVNTLMSGMEKCILPECQMTGNPKTADMCQSCYQSHMDMEREMGRGSSGASDEGFVVVNTKEEDMYPRKPDTSERVKSDIDRRLALLSQLGLEDRPRSQQRQPMPAPRHDAQAHHIQSAPVSAKPPVITVQKDLCATPACVGVRLRTSDLCRACKDNKNPGSRDMPRAGPRPVPQDRPVMRSEPPNQHKTYQEPQRTCKIRICQQLAAPPNYKYCHDCLEDMDPKYQMYSGSNISQSTPVGAAGFRSPDHPYRPQDFASQQRNVSNQTVPVSGMRERNLSNQTVPVLGVRERNFSNEAIPGGRKSENINSTLVPSKKMDDKTIRGTSQYLDQQLRDQYNRPDKSDSSPTKLREEFFESPKQITRIKCQRSKGCPDEMFGDPEKRNLCSRCWKEVGATLPANNPKTTSEGALTQYRDPANYTAGTSSEGAFTQYRDPANYTAGRNNYPSESAVRPGTVRPPGGQNRKSDNHPTYSGKADSGYQHSQEMQRYPERNSGDRQGDLHREYPVVDQNEGHYQYPTGVPQQNEGHYQYPTGVPQRKEHHSGGRPGDDYHTGERPREEYHTGARPRDAYHTGGTDHLYEELDERCAQYGCHKLAGNNVEKFCKQCHENYKAIFVEHRQINE